MYLRAPFLPDQASRVRQKREAEEAAARKAAEEERKRREEERLKREAEERARLEAERIQREVRPPQRSTSAASVAANTSLACRKRKRNDVQQRRLSASDRPLKPPNERQSSTRRPSPCWVVCWVAMPLLHRLPRKCTLPADSCARQRR